MWSCCAIGTSSLVEFARYIGGVPVVADRAGDAAVYVEGQMIAKHPK